MDSVAIFCAYIDYVQRECNEKYDICNNPEEFELFVNGEVTN